MALPPVRKIWQYTKLICAAAGSANASCKVLALAYEKALTGAGSWNNRAGSALGGAPVGAWVVYASSNGVAAGHDNVDRWNSVADVVAGASVSWFAASNVLNGMHMCGCFSSDLQTMRVQVSRIGFGAAYGGSDGNTTTPPSATDAQSMIGVTAWGGPATDLATALKVLIATDGSTLVLMHRNSNIVGLQYMAKIKNPTVGMHPQSAIGRGFSADGSSRLLTLDSFQDGVHWLKAWKTDGSNFGPEVRYTTLFDVQTAKFLHVGIDVPNGLDGSYPLSPVAVYAFAGGAAPVGVHGFAEDICFSLDVLTSGDCFDGEDPPTVRRFAHFDFLAVPWDTSIPDVNPNGVEPARTLRVGSYTATLAELSPDVVPPVISNVLPAPGSAFTKHMAWQFDVTDEGGLSDVMLSVKCERSSAREVVYENGEFEGLYNGSTVTPITDGLRFVIRRLGGWPGAPSFRPRAVDSGGNFNA